MVKASVIANVSFRLDRVVAMS